MAPTGHWVYKEDPLTDVAVVAASLTDYRDQHPTSALLVIEVALSTEDTERLKTDIYAEAGILEYWLVLPEKKQIEVFSQPHSATYAQVRTFGEGMSVRSSVLSDFEVDVEGLFEK